MPSLLSMGAGASTGLDDFLTRMLTEEKLKQQGDQIAAGQAETSRHNLATEDNAARQHQLMSMDTQARIRESEANHAEQAQNRTIDNGRALAEELPGGTVIPEGDNGVTQMREAGLNSILRGIKSRPAVDVGPLEPEDKGQAVPVDSVLKMSTAKQSKPPSGGDYNVEEKTVLYKGKPTPVSFDPRAVNKAGARGKYTLPATGEDISDQVGHYEKPQTPDRVLIQTGDGYMRRPDAAATLAGGGTVDAPTTGQTRNRRDMADAVGSHFDDVSQLIDEANKRGLLGPLRGRTFAEFMAGKVGSTGNADDDQLLGDLRTQMGMIRSGVASLHGRAGANQGIAKEIEKRMDEGFMDPAMLHGSLGGLKKWVDTYARKKGSDGTTGSGAKADLVFDPATGLFKKPE